MFEWSCLNRETCGAWVADSVLTFVCEWVSVCVCMCVCVCVSTWPSLQDGTERSLSDSWWGAKSRGSLHLNQEHPGPWVWQKHSWAPVCYPSSSSLTACGLDVQGSLLLHPHTCIHTCFCVSTFSGMYVCISHTYTFFCVENGALSVACTCWSLLCVYSLHLMKFVVCI